MKDDRLAEAQVWAKLNQLMHEAQEMIPQDHYGEGGLIETGASVYSEVYDALVVAVDAVDQITGWCFRMAQRGEEEA